MSEPVFNASQTPEPVLATVGDINLTQHWIVTPTGSFPIRGSVWSITDTSHRQERIAPFGIILAILFFWVCLLGLFFLLMKETVVSGSYQITVQGNGFHYSSMVPANQTNLDYLHQRVNYARTLAAAP